MLTVFSENIPDIREHHLNDKFAKTTHSNP